MLESTLHLLRKRGLLFSLSFCSFLSAFSQGKVDGFFRGQGTLTTVFSLGFEDTKNYFAGTKKTDISRNLYYANLYGSYGITDTFDISLSVPYLISNQNRNFQDALVFAKFRVLNKTLQKGILQTSFAVGLSAPITNYDVGGLNDIGQQATVIESRVVVHYHHKSGVFSTFVGGFSYKFNQTPESIPLTLKLGRSSVKWYYDFYYSYQYSFGGIDYNIGVPSQDFRALGVNFHKLGGTLYTSMSENFGAFASLSYIVAGRNVFQGPSYGLGLVYNIE